MELISLITLHATPEGYGAVNDGADITVDGNECKPENLHIVVI